MEGEKKGKVNEGDGQDRESKGGIDSWKSYRSILYYIAAIIYDATTNSIKRIS